MSQEDLNLAFVVAFTAICVGAIMYGAGRRGSLISRRVVGSLGCLLYAALLVWMAFAFATAGLDATT